MPGPLRVLIIEEEDEQVNLILRTLQQGGFQPTHRVVDTPQAMTNALDKEKWQAVISNYSLPYFSATAALEILQKKGIDLPFIIISRSIGEEAVVAAIKAGAHDFVLEHEIKRLPIALDREIKEAAQRRSRRWTEEALRRNEARERAILESALDCIISFTHDGKITEFNPAAERAFGYPRAAVVGKDVLEVVIPQAMREPFRKGLANYLAKGVWDWLGRRMEAEATRADGTVFPIEMAMNVFRVEGPPMFTLIIRDITDRRLQEESLRQSEERVRTLFEGIDDAVFVHDEEGRILDCNEAACRRLGYTRQELLSMRTGDIDAPEFAETFFERLAQQAAVGRCNFEGVHVTKDGRRISVDINTSVINYQGRGAVLAVMRDITARKQAEEQLRESQAFYHSLVENMTQSILRKDRDGRFTFANQKACSLMERPLEDIVGKTDYDFFPKELADKYRADDKKVLATGQILDLVEEHQSPKGGERIYVHVVKAPIRDAKGEIIGTQIIFWDETERIRQQEEVRRAQQFLRSVFENLPVGVFIKDAKDLSFVEWNPANEKIHGLKREELLGKTDYDFFPKQEADFFTKKDREVLSSRQLLDIPEEEVQTKHQGKRVLHTRKIPILDGTGEPRYLLGVSMDITERKRAEDALREAEAFYESLVENVPMAIFRKDLQGRFTFANQRFCEALKKSRGEIIGKSDYDFFPRQEAEKFRADDQRVVETGKIFQTIEENQPEGGELRYVEVIKAPIRDSEGKIIGISGYFWDVTSRVRAEADASKVRTA